MIESAASNAIKGQMKRTHLSKRTFTIASEGKTKPVGAMKPIKPIP